MEQKHINISNSINSFHDAHSIITKCIERQRHTPLKSMQIYACIRPNVKAIKHSTTISILSSRTKLNFIISSSYSWVKPHQYIKWSTIISWNQSNHLEIHKNQFTSSMKLFKSINPMHLKKQKWGGGWVDYQLAGTWNGRGGGATASAGGSEGGGGSAPGKAVHCRGRGRRRRRTSMTRASWVSSFVVGKKLRQVGFMGGDGRGL